MAVAVHKKDGLSETEGGGLKGAEETVVQVGRIGGGLGVAEDDGALRLFPVGGKMLLQPFGIAGQAFFPFCRVVHPAAHQVEADEEASAVHESEVLPPARLVGQPKPAAGPVALEAHEVFLPELPRGLRIGAIVPLIVAGNDECEFIEAP